MFDLDEWLGKVDDLNDCGRLNGWETDFIDSLLKQSDEPEWTPSTRQINKVNEMHREYCDE